MLIMRKVVIELSGIFMFFVGFVFMINYLSGITGYAVSDQVNPEFSSIAGIVFIVGGLMLFIAGRHQENSDTVSVNPKKGVRKIKFAIASRTINYDKLKRLTKETGYKFVEMKDYAAVFSPKDEIIKNTYQYPIIIPYDKKDNKELLMRVLRGIIDDYEEK